MFLQLLLEIIYFDGGLFNLIFFKNKIIKIFTLVAKTFFNSPILIIHRSSLSIDLRLVTLIRLFN